MATSRDLLAEAQRAQHALVTGQAPRVVVDQNGERVEFTPANMAELNKYINSLQAKIAGTRSNRPMGVYF